MKRTITEKREITLTQLEVQEAIVLWLKSKHRETVSRDQIKMKFPGIGDYAEVCIEVKKEKRNKSIVGFGPSSLPLGVNS